MNINGNIMTNCVNSKTKQEWTCVFEATFEVERPRLPRVTTQGSKLPNCYGRKLRTKILHPYIDRVRLNHQTLKTL